jgi:hypothetical protein
MTLNISNRLLSGSQVVSAIRPALAGHPRQLGGGGFRSAGEHDPAGRDDRVELAVAEGQALRVADAVLDLEPLGPRALSRRPDQILAEIDADHRGPTPRDQARGPAGSGGEVQDALARPRGQAQHRMLDRVRDAAADLIVAGPARVPDRRGFLVT